MKKRMLTFLAAMLFAATAAYCASADSITLSGTVIPAETVPVFAPVSGTAESISAETGQAVQAEDTLYTMKTTKVYADRDGKVSGIFGQPGDDAAAVSERYGAVLYLEETPAYTVSASTSGAYNSMDTKYVHPGEYVYVISRNSADRYGEGVITTVSGTSYSVEIRKGVFLTGETVEVFRDPAYDYHLRIGKGTVTHSDPAAVTAAGGIVRIAVEDGAEVKRGDLLLETVDGTFDAYEMTGTEICAGQSGVIGSISVQAGNSVEKGSVAAEIYPLDRMRVEAGIPEEYCSQIRAGDPVTVELETDTSRRFSGNVVLVSSIATETTGEEETEISYRIVAEFIPDETVRFGMRVLILAGEEAETEQAEEIRGQEEESRGQRGQEEEAEGQEEEPSGEEGEKERERPHRN